MNLRRGLLRLWVVLSLAWIIAVGFHAYSVVANACRRLMDHISGAWARSSCSHKGGHIGRMLETALSKSPISTSPGERSLALL
jgi:hypothetical protein